MGMRCSLKEAKIIMDAAYNVDPTSDDPGTCSMEFSTVSYVHSQSPVYAGDPSSLPISKQCADQFGIIEDIPGPYPYLDGSMKGTSCQTNPTKHSVSCDLSDFFMSVNRACESEGGNIHLLDFAISKDCSQFGNDVTYTNSTQCAPQSCTSDEVIAIFDSFSWIMALSLSSSKGCQIRVAPSSYEIANSTKNTKRIGTNPASLFLLIPVLVVLIVGGIMMVMKRKEGFQFTRMVSRDRGVTKETTHGFELKHHVAVAAEVVQDGGII